MKKSLLVTASTFPRWVGDTEPRFVLDLSEALSKYYEVTVLVPSAPGAKQHEKMGSVDVIRYHYFPLHKYESLCYPGAIVPRIKQKKIRVLLVPFLVVSLYFNIRKLVRNYDIVQAHWLIPQGIVQAFFKKPFIVTGHGGDITSLNNILIRKLKKFSLNRAKRITVVSDHLKDIVVDMYNYNKIDVIPMGCNINNFGKKYSVTEYFNQKGKPVILFVGRLAEIKGIEYLIDAMKRIDALLIIVGGGPLEDQLKLKANKLNNKINFLGPKTHEELKTIYASSDIFVMPSITAKDGSTEGFGLVVLEAMASNLAIVASNSGGIGSLIKDNENGLLVKEKDAYDLAEKINLLLNDSNLYKKLTNSAYETAKKYDYSNIAEKYMHILERAAK